MTQLSVEVRSKIICGSRVWFVEEQRPYTVLAVNERYVICTKPFFKTVLYTIIDFKENIRGTENTIFCLGFETSDQCDQALERLKTGETEVSRRNRIPLRIKKTQFSKK